VLVGKLSKDQINVFKEGSAVEIMTDKVEYQLENIQRSMAGSAADYVAV
jgi:hypothetical protein